VADYAARATIDPYRIYNKEITITGSMAVLHSSSARPTCSLRRPGHKVFITDATRWSATKTRSSVQERRGSEDTGAAERGLTGVNLRDQATTRNWCGFAVDPAPPRSRVKVDAKAAPR